MEHLVFFSLFPVEQIVLLFLRLLGVCVSLLWKVPSNIMTTAVRLDRGLPSKFLFLRNAQIIHGTHYPLSYIFIPHIYLTDRWINWKSGPEYSYFISQKSCKVAWMECSVLLFVQRALLAKKLSCIIVNSKNDTFIDLSFSFSFSFTILNVAGVR